MRVLKIAGAALLLSAPVFAQDEATWKLAAADKQKAEVAARVPFEKSTKGAPYSADTVVENTQTLADGNRISRKTTGLVYRDSEGRTRREEDGTVSAMTPNGPVTSLRKTISIVDPIAGFSYSLDPEHKIAWKTTGGGAGAIMGKLEVAQVEANLKLLKEKLDAAQQNQTEPKTGAAAAEVKMRTVTPSAAAGGAGGVLVGRSGYVMAPDTPLEHKTIEGVPVEGRKTTTVIPAGQVGNEQPITITSEEWRSTDLNILVLTRHSDPRTGESSYRLMNIVRAEPDRSLFMVPPDYTVKETGIRRMVEPSREQ
ncbi:MAG TPA: hypothetical protein VF921_18580 [Vicinamibacterales bacterium]